MAAGADKHGSIMNPFMTFTPPASPNGIDPFRKFFGTHRAAGWDPMIGGYGMVFFPEIPTHVASGVTSAYTLMSLAVMTNIPSLRMEAVEYEGRDGGKWYVPGKLVMSGNTVTLKFWEMAGLPIYKIISKWVTLLRNPHAGFMTDVNWNQSAYKGRMIYCACTPDMRVHFAKCYAGVMPLDIKDEIFGGEITSQDKIEYECEFQFDHYPYTSTDLVASTQSLVDAVVARVEMNISSELATCAGRTSNMANPIATPGVPGAEETAPGTETKPLKFPHFYGAGDL